MLYLIRKIILVLVFLSFSVSLFSQTKIDEKSQTNKKNILRVYPEFLYVFNSEGVGSTPSWDHASNGIIISYSRLFNDFIGISISTGIYYGYVTDLTNFSSSDFEKENSLIGLSLKIGPYFRIKKIGVTPFFEIKTLSPYDSESKIYDSDNPDFTFTHNPSETLMGFGVNVDFYLTKFLLLNLEGAILTGFKTEDYSTEYTSSGSFFSWTTTGEVLTKNTGICAISFSIGLGIAF